MVKTRHQTAEESTQEESTNLGETGATSGSGTDIIGTSADSTRAATAVMSIVEEGTDTTLKPTSDQMRTLTAKSVTSRHSRRSEQRLLLKAKEKLLMKQTELAALRLELLMQGSDDESEEDDIISTSKARTEKWVEDLPHASPHIDFVTKKNEKTRIPPTCSEAPPPATCKVPATPTLPSGGATREEKLNTVSTPAQNTHFNYSELAAAITFAVRSAQPVAAPRSIPELPIFTGASSEWLPFKVAYEESANYLGEQDNLARLRRSLKGAAREAVQCLFVGSTTTEAVMKLLAARFGRPDALVMVELEKLRSLPRLNENPRDVCIFASKVANITATVKALHKEHYLYNPEVVRSVVEKLPSTLRYRYYDYSAERPEDEPDLEKIAKFLEITADRCGRFAPAENTQIENRRELQHFPAKKPTRTYLTAEKPSAPSTPFCCICNEDHRLSDCTKFKTAEVTARWDIARNNKLCFRCLKNRKFRHTCKPKRCEIDGCRYLHHPLLHDPAVRMATREQPNKLTTAIVTSARNKDDVAALLKILPVRLAGPKGVHDTYALLDDGSTCTLIETNVAEKIGATGPVEPFFIEGVAGATIDANQSRRVNFTIQGRQSEVYSIEARTMNRLHLSPQSVSADIVRGCHHLNGIENQLTFNRGTPTVLIGQDNWNLLLSQEILRGEKHQPVASRTDLGWVLHGTHERKIKGRGHRVAHLHCNTRDDKMEELMKEHFALESLGIEPKRSYTDDERRALHLLKENTRRLPAGGFQTALLWRYDNIKPPQSYDMAVRRLELVEKKLDRDENLKRRYKAQLEVLIENGYAEPALPTKTEKIWYLPHFAVINPQKPEKLRIVHDAAAKTKGTSLNDMLLSGPDLLQSLPGVLMRFRQRPIAVAADIKDMFLRVTINEEDRDMQRYLWRGDRRSGPPDEYRMRSVIFGATSSPCTAIYVKNKNAEYFNDQYPRAAAAVVNNHYVDDYLDSFDTEEEAIRISHQVAFIHSKANYFLQRWASNSQQLVSTLSPGTTKPVLQLDKEKVLGMVWNTVEDTLSFNINRHKIPADILSGERTPTKREALSTMMSLYDPLGIATPVTIQAKRILQDTWRSGIEWDEELQPSQADDWRNWTRHMQRLSQLAVPRCHPDITNAQMRELHVFVDASSSAYATAVYWRIVREGKIYVSLIAGKSRVAPVTKVTSIPRLELQAAVLGCRLARTAIDEHELKPTRRVYWTDSTTVLTWLRNGPRAYKPFVAHRLAEIMEETKTKEWRWVPTRENVADDATRDTPADFGGQHRWFRGPDFLHSTEECWPQEDTNFTPQLNTGEERINAIYPTTRLAEALPDITRFTNWMRVIRATAWALRFIEKIRIKHRCAIVRKRTKKTEADDPTWRRKKNETQRRQMSTSISSEKLQVTIPLEACYIQRAQQLWVRSQQQELFNVEIFALQQGKPFSPSSRLAPLSVVQHSDGIIRLRSRVAIAADITTAQSEPAIIDGDHRWTHLYIGWVHRQLHHGGFETTTNEVRQHYWVLRLRNAVRCEIKRCQICRIRRATPAQPSTGNHPHSRLAHHQRPFTYAGVDYFGPLTVTVGRTHQKRYGVLFTCLTTRAVHLEVANSLSTDSAVMALRRFISRRGCPTELWSDHGTNLRGADQELKKAAQDATSLLQQEASIKSINWRYIPPSAPFMGGAWERLVRSVKTALKVTLHERAPKEEVLATLLVEAEFTINSRPLTHVSTSPEDEEAITPNHFLLGGPARVPLPGAFTEQDAAGRKEWRVSQRLADMFWARWVREYLPLLQHRREPRASKGAIQLNDLVLIADGTLPRNSWPRGIVVATYPGPDGEIRAVDVRTTKGTLRRPTKKLVILPVEST